MYALQTCFLNVIKSYLSVKLITSHLLKCTKLDAKIDFSLIYLVGKLLAPKTCYKLVYVYLK